MTEVALAASAEVTEATGATGEVVVMGTGSLIQIVPRLDGNRKSSTSFRTEFAGTDSATRILP